MWLLPLSKRRQLIEEYFETENDVDWEPRYNIAPSQAVGIIRRNPPASERRFSLARWGLIPPWDGRAGTPCIGVGGRLRINSKIPHVQIHLLRPKHFDQCVFTG